MDGPQGGPGGPDPDGPKKLSCPDMSKCLEKQQHVITSDKVNKHIKDHWYFHQTMFDEMPTNQILGEKVWIKRSVKVYFLSYLLHQRQFNENTNKI